MSALLLLASAVVAAGTPDGAAPTLRVAVAGSVPFVVAEPRLGGLSVDVFEAIAASTGRPPALTLVPTVKEAIELVGRGEADVAVGPISVTAERLRAVAFTQPYFQAGLSTLERPGSSTAWDRLAPLLSAGFFWGVGGLLLVLTVVGALVWLAERRANPQQFPPGVRAGVGAGLWLALVTMTTVGYGDKAPVTTRGRLLTGVWMLISMMFASSLTAGIAAALTLSTVETSINHPRDLRGRRVATVAGSTSVEFAQQHQAVVAALPSLEEAIAQLEAKQVDAVLFDRPMLLHALRARPGTNAVLSDAEWEPRSYAFVVPIGSPLQHPLNLALVELAESGRLAPLRVRWLGE